MKKNIIASLDIGTTKTCAIIAESKQNSKLNILGIGTAPSEGMTIGTVANILETAESIKKAVEIAENQAGVKISSVNIGVAGNFINSMRYRNFVTINNPDFIINESDLERLLNDIRMTRIPSDYFILHILPEKYIIDNKIETRNPVGVVAQKLEAYHHIVLAQKTATNNLKLAVEKAGLKINKMILQSLASANAVLDKDEKELGVAMIDIGGGTTDLAVYVNGSIRHTLVIPIAGNHVTNDIRAAFRLITDQCEKLKIEFGYATPKAIVEDREVYVQVSPVRPPIIVSISVLTEIIHLRMKELFLMVNQKLKDENLKNQINAGIVLTGGGALLKGCVELAQEVFDRPARLGIPYDLGSGLSKKVENPVYSTAVGLLLNDFESYEVEKEKNKKLTFSFKRIMEKISGFFKEF